MASLFVISGPSGVGKGTLIRKVLEQIPNTHLAISACTRSPRTGEVDGKDYYFMDVESFKDKISRDEFAEWCEVHGNYYGTLKSEIDKNRDQGRHVLVEIDTQGTVKLKRVYDELQRIFVAPPTLEELELRLTRRNTDDSETIARRLNVAQKELDEIGNYDYIVVNQDIDESVISIIDVIKSNLSEELK